MERGGISILGNVGARGTGDIYSGDVGARGTGQAGGITGKM